MPLRSWDYMIKCRIEKKKMKAKKTINTFHKNAKICLHIVNKIQIQTPSTTASLPPPPPLKETQVYYIQML